MKTKTITIRNVPVDSFRDFKVYAAERGLDLGPAFGEVMEIVRQVEKYGRIETCGICGRLFDLGKAEATYEDEECGTCCIEHLEKKEG